MKIVYHSVLNNEAMKNVEGFDFTKLSYKEVYNSLKEELVKAFDGVTTFDIRSAEQIQVFLCDMGYVVEKDLKTYPAVVLTLQIMDWDSRNNCKDMWRKANFQLKISPYICALDKEDEITGVYGGYDKDLTKAWRKFMDEKYPEWAQAFKRYAIEARDIKIEKAKSEFEFIRDKADKEYNEEFDF